MIKTELIQDMIKEKLDTFGRTLTIKEIIELAGDSYKILDIKMAIRWDDLADTQAIMIMYTDFVIRYEFNVENKQDGALFVHEVTVL